jgi:hypothetical protein
MEKGKIMRLIDADALKGLFIQVLENIKSNPRMTGQEKHIITAIHTVGQMIDDAPTIIPEGGGRVMNLNNPKTLDEAIEIIKEINPEYEETNTRTAETMVLCAVKDGELVDKHTIGAVPHWIPVSERLPDRRGRYLVYSTTIPMWEHFILNYDPEYNQWFWDGLRSEGCDINVIAWMPLPKPYEVEHDQID